MPKEVASDGGWESGRDGGWLDNIRVTLILSYFTYNKLTKYVQL
jgi:hypothetical protein